MHAIKQKAFLIISILVVIVILFHIPREWIYDNSNSVCIHKSIFGIECPFCGMSRALYEMVHLNFNNAIQRNFVVIPFVITIFCWTSTIVFKNASLRKVAWIMTYITATGFVIIYVLRIIG
jgi:hypothetical protein